MLTPARWSSSSVPRTLRADISAHLPRDAAPSASPAIQTGRPASVRRCRHLPRLVTDDDGRPGDGQGGHRRPARPRRRLLHRDRRRHAPALRTRGHRRTGQPSRAVHPAAARWAVVARQPGRGGRVRAAGGGARLRFRAAGAGDYGDLAAVRAADQRAAEPSPGDPVGMAVGGAARRGGGGDRDRRQSDGGPLARLLRDVDGGGGRARARAGAVRAGRQRRQGPCECGPARRSCPARCGVCSRC